MLSQVSYARFARISTSCRYAGKAATTRLDDGRDRTTRVCTNGYAPGLGPGFTGFDSLALDHIWMWLSLARALGSELRDRRFESSHPDHFAARTSQPGAGGWLPLHDGLPIGENPSSDIYELWPSLAQGACLGGRRSQVRILPTRRGFGGCANEPLIAKF